MSSFWVQFCWVDSQRNSGNVTGGKQLTGDDGVATLTNVPYPDSSTAYAYYAVPACGGSQSLASSPLQLTVGANTTLLLNVTRLPDSNTHVFVARLVNDGRSGLNEKQLRLKLNDAEYEAKKAIGNGVATGKVVSGSEVLFIHPKNQ